MNIRKRIAIAMVLISFLAVLLIAFIANTVAWSILQDRSTAYLTSLLNQNTYHVNNQLRTVEKVAEGLQRDFLATYEGFETPGYREKYLAVYASVVKLASELSPSNLAYAVFLDQRRDFIWYERQGLFTPSERRYESALIDPFLGLENQLEESLWLKRGKTYSHVHIFEAQPGVKLLVGSDLDMDFIVNLLQSSKYLDSGRFYLLDQTGTPIYNPRGDDPFAPIASEIGTTAQAETDAVVRVEQRLVNGWYLGIQVDKADIYSGFERMQLLTAAVLATSIAMIGIYSTVVSRRIAGPFQYLTERIESIGKGDYDVVLDKSYSRRLDEIGTLTRAIESMVERQKETFDALNAYSINLEGLVADRTHALQEANAALEASLIEIVETREKLIATEKIASSRYVAIGIAHNLNTPIGNIQTLLGYLANRVAAMQGDFKLGTLTKLQLEECFVEFGQASDTIQVNLDTAIRMIKKLKDLSEVHLSSHQMDLEVYEVIQSQVAAIQTEFPTQAVQVSLDIAPHLTFFGDLYAFSQIFHELLENSYVHAFQGVANPEIRISAWLQTAGVIRVHYADNGPGVDSDQLKELFTPLFTSKLSTRHGLGLAMLTDVISTSFEGTIKVNNLGGLSYDILLKERK